MIILQDTKEKQPWNFSFYNVEVEKKSLKTGDYSLKNFSNKVCIERKKTTGEIAINFGSKKKQFTNELLRMCLFPHKLIIFEFPEEYLDFFPNKSSIPQKTLKYIKISSYYLKKCIYSIKDTYGIDIIFCNNKEQAEQEAFLFLKESYDKLK